MQEPLAHSPRFYVGPQPYRAHIENVRRGARLRAKDAGEYFTGDPSHFTEIVEAAAEYHDLGKLDEANQKVLARVSRNPLEVPHEDAGVAALLEAQRNEEAVLVAAHHAGLFSRDAELEKGEQMFRRIESGVAEHVDRHLHQYLGEHERAGRFRLSLVPTCALGGCGFTRRLALSCLVDADHSDTARHYGHPGSDRKPTTRWVERLFALDEYVGSLPVGTTAAEQRRNEMRRRLYNTCRGASTDPPMRACDAPVGTGKTTAVMAHLLRVANERGLRHIFVVLPYTNIIRQSVQTYRNALVLPGERPDEVVAEHHHQAEFADPDLRHLTTLWRAPIIVTTAVQFFETLAAHHPARLRKLHELPGSAVFVDETHAAVPSDLWPQLWRWLETWCCDWSGHIVFASGSLPRFWEQKVFVDPPKAASEVADLVPQELRNDLEQEEQRRIHLRSVRGALSLEELAERVLSEPGPRLVILNTVQSAAVVAVHLRKKGQDTLHLSTSLAPIHRDRIVAGVQARLDEIDDPDWTLVATSCVEAGMDFSFRSGFRESATTASLIQVGGRVGRKNEYEDATVWDFRVSDPLLSQHPAFEVPRRVLRQLFNSRQVGQVATSELASTAMAAEVTEDAEQNARRLQKAEHAMEYPEVARRCRVISEEGLCVLIDQDIAERIRNHQEVSALDIQRFSVQMWPQRVRELAVPPLFPDQEGDRFALYVWPGKYDRDFTGYMAGVLDLLYGCQSGFLNY